MNRHLQNTHLLRCATDSRCKQCPPDRVCAWDCVQGMNMEDIIIGAMLEQGQDWAFRPVAEAGQESNQESLWEMFNK